MSAHADAFPVLHDLEEGDQIYLRAGHTTAQLQVQVRRGQEVWQGELAEEGWRLYPVGGRVLGQPYGTVRRGQDGRLWIKLTGLQILPMAAPSRQQAQQPPQRRGRDDMSRASPQDREEVRNFHRNHAAAVEAERRRAAAAQPVREQGWSDRVRAVRSADDALGLVEEVQERVPSASTRLAIYDQLVTHLVQGPEAPLQRAGLEELGALAQLVTIIGGKVGQTLLSAIGARRLELPQGERVERDPAYLGGEERLNVSE